MICVHESGEPCLLSEPHCGFCGAPMADGGPCGRDACPGEATRQRANFGTPPPPRQPAAWKRAGGLRLQRGKVMEIAPKLGEAYRYPPGILASDVPGLRRRWWVRAWRRLLEVLRGR